MQVDGGDPYRGHAGVRSWWDRLLAVYPDFGAEIEEVRDLGDLAIARVRMHGRGDPGRRRDPAAGAGGAWLAHAEPRSRPRGHRARNRGRPRQRARRDQRRGHLLRSRSSKRTAGGAARLASCTRARARLGTDGLPHPQDPPPVERSLRLVKVDTAERATAFSRLVRLSYGLPQAIEPRPAGLPDVGWLCWLALDGDEPAGAAALYGTGAGVRTALSKAPRMAPPG
jgi:SnoaL-like domain